LLSTSEGEGFPSVFLEAWAHGTPVASLTVNPDRLITRKGLGVVNPSIAETAANIGRLVGSVDERQEAAIRVHDYAVQIHSGAAVAATVERVLSTGSAPVLQPCATDHGQCTD
jgi:glycosyltransferase involved in cell wall biosynthesis